MDRKEKCEGKAYERLKETRLLGEGVSISEVFRVFNWNVLKMCGVGGQLAGVEAFYREASACVRVNGKLSEGLLLEWE